MQFSPFLSLGLGLGLSLDLVVGFGVELKGGIPGVEGERRLMRIRAGPMRGRECGREREKEEEEGGEGGEVDVFDR